MKASRASSIFPAEPEVMKKILYVTVTKLPRELRISAKLVARDKLTSFRQLIKLVEETSSQIDFGSTNADRLMMGMPPLSNKKKTKRKSKKTYFASSSSDEDNSNEDYKSDEQIQNQQ